jgi:drug/metabolite transporter (DMT)-like permease
MSVIRRRRGPGAWAGAAFLGLEGVGLVIGRGNCPVGPQQTEWGDPVPFFELVLPKRAAKAAVPVLAAVAVTGIALLVIRRPGAVLRA